ncbi:NRDE family protein [Bacterioplanoides sp.]|uniref:NRDE family protein n=1 Tax=Bacterioplanoides sp. TaxID=2066072 RepID=UPI003B009C1C
MCLIAFDWQAEKQQLVLVANRDEFYQRPSQALHPWPEYPALYAGKDLQQGGTWLGVTQQRRFAALTNIRAPGHDPEQPLSRGNLVLDFLTSELNAETWLQQLASTAQRYGLYNLICFDGTNLWYSHNHPEFHYQKLSSGLYGLSNAHLNTPWPKTELAKQQLAAWQHQTAEPVPADLLNRRLPFADEQLPQTGVPLAWEQLLSSQFILSPQYGTRCSTSLHITSQQLIINEILWQDSGEQQQITHFTL